MISVSIYLLFRLENNIVLFHPSYVPIHRFVENINLVKVYAFIKKLVQNYLNAFSDMMIFDAVICNTDRHFGNFGLMVDNKTNFVCPAF